MERLRKAQAKQKELIHEKNSQNINRPASKTFAVHFDSHHARSWLPCGCAEDASPDSCAGWWLSGREYGGRTDRAVKSHHRRIQYCGWFPVAQKRHHWRVEHGHWRWDTSCQHGGRKYSAQRR